MRCDHSGAHSGVTHYVRQSGQLRLVLVCDTCGAELTEMGTLEYEPHPALAAAPGGAVVPPASGGIQ